MTNNSLLPNQDNFADTLVFRCFKLLVTLSFPVFFIIISFYTRYSSDDYTLMEHVRANGGAWNAANWLYFNYEGSYLIFVREYLFFYFPIPVFLSLTLLLNIASCCFVFHSFFQRIGAKVELIDSLLTASVIICASYFLSIDVQGTYHWMAGTTYIASLSFTFWGIGFMLRNKPWFALPFFIVVMMSRINFSLLVYSAYGLLFLYTLTFKKTFDKKMFFSLIIMAIAIVLYVVAPGNWVRSITNENEESNILPIIKLVLFDEYVKHLPRTLFFTTIIALILPEALISKIRLTGWKLTLPLVTLIFFAILNMVSLFIATKLFYYGYRVWVMNTWLYIVFMTYYTLIFKSYLRNWLQKKHLSLIENIALILLMLTYLGYNAKHTITNQAIAKKYAEAYDEMVCKITKSNISKNDTLWIPFLPKEGVLREHLIEPTSPNIPYEIVRINKNFWKYYGVKGAVIMTHNSNLHERYNHINCAEKDYK